MAMLCATPCTMAWRQPEPGGIQRQSKLTHLHTEYSCSVGLVPRHQQSAWARPWLPAGYARCGRGSQMTTMVAAACVRHVDANSPAELHTHPAVGSVPLQHAPYQTPTHDIRHREAESPSSAGPTEAWRCWMLGSHRSCSFACSSAGTPYNLRSGVIAESDRCGYTMLHMAYCAAHITWPKIHRHKSHARPPCTAIPSAPTSRACMVFRFHAPPYCRASPGLEACGW